ncbi:MAG: rubrerythrin [Clostridiales bacterium GWD2_32_59]|nr:MAG: rubrerythrin [Clostridiales bacterium GWD2_32_59]
MSLEGTKTAENLLKSFAGESQARMRYDYYSKVALKEGYVQISKIFEETALNEKEHAKRFFKFLNADLKGQTVNITAAYPVLLGDTLENLKAAAAGESEEWKEVYPEFAKIAEEEGFHHIAMAFRKIAEVEARHEHRYNKLVENIENGKVFKREETHEWKCNNCGYIHKGTGAPEICPACEHPKDFFELFVENY